MSRWIAATLLFLATAAGAAGLEGRKAPALKLAGVDGVKTTLQDVAGDRIAIVLFWASWCPYCKALMPSLHAIAREFGSERVVVVAVNAWEDAEVDPAALLREEGPDFVLLLRGGKAAKAWKVRGTPGLFVVDRGGTVVYDRNARPLRPAASAPPELTGPPALPAQLRPSISRSAEYWASDLRAVLQAELAKPPPPPAVEPTQIPQAESRSR